MSGKVRRAAGITLIVAACAVGAAEVSARHADANSAAIAARAASSAGQQIEELWQAERRRLEQRVADVTAMPPLQSALIAVGGATALQSLLNKSEWWKSVTDTFKAVRVISEAQVIAQEGPLDLGTADRNLVAAARLAGSASSALSVHGGAWLAAAARIPPLTRAVPVLELATPIDGNILDGLADRSGQAVMLADADGSAAAAGSGPQRALIRKLAGREREPTIVDPAGRWVAALVVLGPGVRVWTLKADQIPGLPARGLGLVAWAVTMVLGVAGVLVLFGGRPGGMVSGVIKGEATLPFGAPLPSPGQGEPARGEQAGGAVDRPSRTPPPPRAGSESSKVSARVAPVTGSKLPRALGRYTLLEHLGQGGMADVYIAAINGAQGFRRTFVLKRIRAELAQDKAAVSHFVDEACLQAGLVHTNIVPVFDFGLIDGEYFMTEEYVLGRDVARLAERHEEQTARPLDANLAFYIAQETLHALQYAHTKRDKDGQPLAIVHRDVSPGNIIVSLAGDVKLFDFGITKSNSRTSRTQFGMVKGNANFMSPEQARGKEVDGRSDLFSLGLVLYFCLTGRLLYQGENDLELIHLAAAGPTERDLNELRGLPQPGRDILLRALAADQNQRFQSAAEFAEALAPHVSQGKSAAAALMQALFGEDLRREAA
jgi:protein kinase-like protein